MANYFATELGLTKATRALLDNKPIQFCKPAPEFAPLVKQDNKIVVITKSRMQLRTWPLE